MDPETLDGRILGVRPTESPQRRDMSTTYWIATWAPPTTQTGGVAADKLSGTYVIENVAKLYEPNRKVELVIDSVKRFANDCANAFCELSGYARAKVGAVPTPFLDESKDPLVVIQEPTKRVNHSPVKGDYQGWVYPERGD